MAPQNDRRLEFKIFSRLRRAFKRKLVVKVTGGKVSRAIFPQCRHFLFAHILHIRAAWVKWTARRRVCRTGDFTLEYDRLHHFVRVEGGDGGHECFGIWMLGLIKQFRSWSDFDESSEIHDCHAIAHMFNYAEVMGDK